MRPRVVPIMIVAGGALMVGLWAGLARIGWHVPAPDGLMYRHGGLMVVGFTATVIGVECAVAVRSTLSLVPPVFSAGAGVALIAGVDAPVAPFFALLSAASYVALIAGLERQHQTLPLRLMLAGGTWLAAAALMWMLDSTMQRVVPWWMAFLALTIGAERLDLLRFQRATRASTSAGLAALVLVAAGPVITVMWVEFGVRVLGAGLVIGSGWPLMFDHVRRGLHNGGLAPYTAIGLLWAVRMASAGLAFTGFALLAGGFTTAGWHYDAVVHAFFIGVVMSAIFAHEPIIAPSIRSMQIPFQSGTPARAPPGRGSFASQRPCWNWRRCARGRDSCRS